MKNKLPGPHRRGEGGRRDAETGCPARKAPDTAYRGSRASNAERSGAGFALAVGTIRRETVRASTQQQEALCHRASKSLISSRWLKSRKLVMFLGNVTDAGSARAVAVAAMPPLVALPMTVGVRHVRS